MSPDTKTRLSVDRRAAAQVTLWELFLGCQLDFSVCCLSEQAPAGGVSGGVFVPIVAQPAFMTRSLREYEDCSVWNLVSVAWSGSCWALVTQNGTRAATTAVSDLSDASCSAVPCVVQPSCEKPTVAIAIAPIAAPQSPGFSQTGICMGFFLCVVGGLISSHRQVKYWLKWGKTVTITSPAGK